MSTAVAMLTIYPPKVYASVAEREDAEMFTILLPIKMALSILEVWFSVISRTIAARLFPSSARARRRILFTVVSAVSFDEKNAESIRRMISMIN